MCNYLAHNINDQKACLARHCLPEIFGAYQKMGVT